jgi:hypothetical protein
MSTTEKEIFLLLVSRRRNISSGSKIFNAKDFWTTLERESTLDQPFIQ